MVNNLRDEKQKEVSRLWIESNRKNTLILGTGFGKSLVSMLILETLFKDKILNKKSKILLLSDSEKLRDDNWKEDFEKWGFSWMWDIIQSECYQTAYKWEDTSWDLIIADEIDFGLTEMYSKVFTNNEYKMILGLTGYVDPSKNELLTEIAPPLVEYSTQDAQNDGILNGTKIVFVEYDLSQTGDDITVEYMKGGKKQSFTQSENHAYSYYEQRCNIIWGKISRLEEDPDVVFGLDPAKISEVKSLRYNFNRMAEKRKSLLLNSKSGQETAKYIIKEILKSDKNKVLTFSAYTNQADAINEFTYHGKNKKGNTSLSDLSDGKIRSVGVCDAINRGMNLVGVNNIVMESYNGSKTKFNQRHGRGMRLLPHQKMYLYILLPYYYKSIESPDPNIGKRTVRRPTQMVKWAESMLEGFRINNPIRIRV